MGTPSEICRPCQGARPSAEVCQWDRVSMVEYVRDKINNILLTAKIAI